MRYWRYSLLIFVLLLLVRIPLHVAAQEKIGENSLSKETIAANIELMFFETDVPKAVIKSFDVRNDGWFAVCLSTEDICVYDENGVFQYGYAIDIDGSYGVTFAENNLSICLSRGDRIVVVDTEGNCISTHNAQVTSDIIERNSKRVGTLQYILERDIGFLWSDYSRLVAVDELGNRTVLYDATTEGYILSIFQNTAIIGFFFLCIIGCIRQLKKTW